MQNSIDLREGLEFAKKLAYEAGGIMRKYFLNTDTQWKEDQTPLTIADTTINSLVIERIAEQYPDHSVLGEEESAMKDSRYTWVCDPVDGTMPYAHGLPISTFSLALCDDGAPVVGVVYDPFMDRLFWALKGDGAYCNDTKLQVNQGHMSQALIDLEGFSVGSGNLVIEGLNCFTELSTIGAKPVSLHSTVLPSCLVAQGEFTAIVFNVKKPEDPAAIKVIVEEAGGKVTDMFGNDQRYDQPTKGFIASNGIVHDELVRIIREASK